MKVARSHLVGLYDVLGFGGSDKWSLEDLENNLASLPDCKLEDAGKDKLLKGIRESLKNHSPIEIIGGVAAEKKEAASKEVTKDSSKEVMETTTTKESPIEEVKASPDPDTAASTVPSSSEKETKPTKEKKPSRPKKAAPVAKEKPCQEPKKKSPSSSVSSKASGSTSPKVAGSTAKAGMTTSTKKKKSKPITKSEKKNSTKKKNSSVGKKKSLKHSRPGILSHIISVLATASKKAPQSKQSVVESLMKKFPDRKKSALICTCAQQIPYKLRKAGHEVKSDEIGYWITRVSAKTTLAA